jgi:hypothetical protein
MFLYLHGIINYCIMKKFSYPVLVILLFALLSINLESCKKGDGDPFISLLSRKARLTGNWKVSKLTSTFSYTNQKFETTYDGTKKKVVHTVKDTLISGALTTYTHINTYTGETITDYGKDGKYYYSETFKDDSTGLSITIEINGLWYFMGGNGQNDYKDKELLAMQVTDYIYNPLEGNDYSTIFQGANSLNIYEIYQLKNKEIILKVNTTETINFIKYTTVLEYTLIPR